LVGIVQFFHVNEIMMS